MKRSREAWLDAGEHHHRKMKSGMIRHWAPSLADSAEDSRGFQKKDGVERNEGGTPLQPRE